MFCDFICKPKKLLLLARTLERESAPKRTLRPDLIASKMDGCTFEMGGSWWMCDACVGVHFAISAAVRFSQPPPDYLSLSFRHCKEHLKKTEVQK